MANIISLNCLVVSRASPESISDHSIITLKISTDETVDQLRPMIKERWPSLFENTLPTDFILYKTTDNRSISNFIQQFKATIQALHYEGIFPHELISRHFNEQPPNNEMHILVYV